MKLKVDRDIDYKQYVYGENRDRKKKPSKKDEVQDGLLSRLKKRSIDDIQLDLKEQIKLIIKKTYEQRRSNPNS